MFPFSGIQLFSHWLFPKNVKANATMPIGILSSNSLALHERESRCFRKNEGESMITPVFALSFCRSAESL